MMYRLDIAQWDDEYPSGGVIATEVENRSLFLFVRDGTVVVGAGLDTVQPLEYQLCDWRYGASALVVHHLFVHPEYWRMGYASRFMEFAEGYASSLACDAVRMDVYAANAAALSLYRSRGYREAGKVVFPRRSDPFICFEKKLVQSEREA
jgi:ribosomal protein S18 acetylase RimI-like enzyme